MLMLLQWVALKWVEIGTVVVIVDMVRPNSLNRLLRSVCWNPIYVIILFMIGAILWPMVLADIKNPNLD